MQPQDAPGECCKWSYWLAILPTRWGVRSLHHEAALARAIYRRHGADPARAVLVHGCPINAGHGRRYGHAWVECRDVGLVIDAQRGLGSPRIVPVERYDALGQITEAVCHYYAAEEAVQWLLATEHYGPWQPHPVPVVDEPPAGGWRFITR